MSQIQFTLRENQSKKTRAIWRALQFVFFLIGLFIYLSLIISPKIGLFLLWNILIPVAPLLLVISAGFWRNVCPLATMVLLPRHLNLSKKKKMSPIMQSKLGFISVVSLFLIVPARHLIFNTDGLASSVLFSLIIIIGLVMGSQFDWKSGWCSSLCPIHPVEKLYGGKTASSLPNAHCSSCAKCSIPCPDSTPGFHPKMVQKNIFQKLTSLILIGGFPGFIWGYFRVPDYPLPIRTEYLFQSYMMPFSGALISLLIYLYLSRIVPKSKERTLINVFAALAISCYYWFRIPSLFGFGKFVNDGLLINLESVLPIWIIYLLMIAIVIFFFYWIVFRNSNKKSWTIRPDYI